MSKAIWIVGIIIVLVLIAGALYYSKRPAPTMNQINSGEEIVISEENQNGNSNSSSENSVNEAREYVIDIANFAFSPSTLTIKAGDSVTWTNRDSSAHTVTSDSGNELDSEIISNGQIYAHVFAQPGTYSYHCALHPGMKATIVVTS